MGKYWKGTKLNFKVFADRKDFIQQGKDANNFILSNVNDVRSYVSDANFSGLDKYENELLYQNQDLLQKSLESFDEIMSKIDMGGSFKKTRLKITDDKRGIFDFGLASKGLYKKQEYFSIELAQNSPDEFATAEYDFKPSGVVPFDFVEETFIGEDKFYWYTAAAGQKYELKKQQQGTRSIELKLPGAKLGYATKTKKAYIIHEKRGGKAKMVELFIPVNQGITFSTAMPLFLAARFFQMYGVMTKISVIRMYSERGDEYVAWSYPIKDYGDEMDFNFMALNGVDTRWWFGIRAVLNAINNKTQLENKQLERGNKNKLNTSDFKTYNGSGSLPPSSQAYVELFSRYRNWYSQEIEKGNIPPLRTDKKLLISGVDETLYRKSSLSTTQIIKVFFKILDTVDFQFNKPEEVCVRIYKRLVTDELDKYYANDVSKSQMTQQEKDSAMNNMRITLTSAFKSYVTAVLFDTYDFPEQGEYEEPKESGEKLQEELGEKISKLNQFLKTL